MASGKCFVHALEPRRPDFESSQTQGIEWLAAAHAMAERTHRGAEVDVDAVHAQMRKYLQRFGCSPTKIARRGHMLEDFTHMDWGRMRVFDVTRAAEGADIGSRNAFFHASACRVFQDYYAEIDPADAPGDIVHVSCTGYVSPSAAQEVVVKKGWHETTQVAHAYHMGCYAAVPALRMAAGFLAADSRGKPRRVDIVHTELCTLHLNPLKHSPEQLVVQSLFADGFIRYAVSSTPPPSSDRGGSGSFEVVALREEMVPDSRDAMTWDLSPSGFAMTLAREVPALIAGSIPGFLDRLFRQAELCYADERKAAVFAVHPGGPKIIEKTAELLGLGSHQTAYSDKVLFENGNMSSATLPHIWHEVGMDSAVAPGTLVVSLAFGPGLSLCGALMRKHGGG